MSLHRVTVKKPVIPQIENRTVHSKNRQSNRRSIEEKLIEGELDQWRGSNDYIRWVAHHRRDPPHVCRQDLREDEGTRIDAETVEQLKHQEHDGESHSEDVEERGHMVGERWLYTVMR